MLKNLKQETSRNPKNVLLVDDNEINIKVAVLFLKDFGIKNIVIARNGKEALKFFNPNYDLVLLDIGLPDLSGIEVCIQMRKFLKGKPLPIIAYSATDSYKEECMKAGFNDFITKPVTVDVLQDVIECFVLKKVLT